MTRLLLAVSALILSALSARADDLIAKGEYLMRAADCASCHTAPGGKLFAGGRAFVLPQMGTVYSPNITPDTATGIGNYTDEDFVRAVRTGVAPGGKHLYPAMPYAEYAKMTRADVLAIKAYLFSLKPVSATQPANVMKFPFDQRWGLMFWNLVNATSG
ncbi:MAG TPA: c-type cytochrome, partial [Alphaproteobacteria bacterium]|nr:c-type cytochrome [Alphaproteobacteria bacterium]